MSLHISVEFPGQELKKSLDNIQGLLDAAKPLAEQLVPDEKVKEAIVKCIQAVHVLLCEAQNSDEERAQKEECIGLDKVNKEKKRQARYIFLRNKENPTEDENAELADLETQLGIKN